MIEQIEALRRDITAALAGDNARSRNARRRRRVLLGAMNVLDIALDAAKNGAEPVLIDGMLTGAIGDLMRHGSIASGPVCDSAIRLMQEIRFKEIAKE